jgi:hypothetical protein
LIELGYLGVEFFLCLGCATLLLHHPTPLKPRGFTQCRVIIVPKLLGSRSSVVICDEIEHFSLGWSEAVTNYVAVKGLL